MTGLQRPGAGTMVLPVTLVALLGTALLAVAVQ